MALMVPEYAHEYAITVEHENGDSESIPWDVVFSHKRYSVKESLVMLTRWLSGDTLCPSPLAQYFSSPSPIVSAEVSAGRQWFVRLSADGYCDATEWDCFGTEGEARNFVRNFHGVDPDTGDELSDDE
jgi:hypothetical protein